MGMASLLAGCAVPPQSNKPVSAPVAAPPVSPRSTEPAPVDTAPPAPAPIQVTPATIQTAQRLATSAIELLESGNEDQASAELQRALQNDPNNKLAQSLLKQIQNDPVATLGRESFPYRVQPGESLSKIAQRFLGDVHLFYVLARYNDLRVPKQLQSGQMIKVPGKAPPVTAAAPAPLSARNPTAGGPAASPPAPAEPVAAAPTPAAPAAPAVDPAKVAERERANKVAAATKAARSAYARQDLVAAIRNWDTVLELDAGNTNAKIERQRAVDLKAKLDRLK
jgi:LysM repeat protein